MHQELRAQRVFTRYPKFMDHKLSPRNSQHNQKETLVGLQRISKEIVESLTKALTPNVRVRQNSQKHDQINSEHKQPLHPINYCEQVNQQQQSPQTYLKQSQEHSNHGYVNFTKFARKISQQPVKEIVIIKNDQKISRQRSQDFHSKQEEWLKMKNDKVLRQQIEKQCREQRTQNRTSYYEKSQTDRFV